MDFLDHYHILHDGNILLLGDFNMPYYEEVLVNNDRKLQALNNFCIFHDLNQYNLITNANDRTLDLVFCNRKCEVLHDNAPLVREDTHHPALFINIELNDSCHKDFSTNNTQKTYNFRKANFPALYKSLAEADWTFLEDYSDANVACDKFYDKLYSILDNHVPLYKNNTHSTRKYPAWFTPDIINYIKLKNRHRMKYKQFYSHYDLSEFHRLRKLIKRLTNDAYKENLKNVQDSIIFDTKNFWKFFHAKKQCSRIPGSMTFT